MEEIWKTRPYYMTSPKVNYSIIKHSIDIKVNEFSKNSKEWFEEWAMKWKGYKEMPEWIQIKCK
jgi:hypothetical protein